MKTREEQLAALKAKHDKLQEKAWIAGAAASGGVGTRVVKALRACESALEDEKVERAAPDQYSAALSGAVEHLRRHAIAIGQLFSATAKVE